MAAFIWRCIADAVALPVGIDTCLCCVDGAKQGLCCCCSACCPAAVTVMAVQSYTVGSVMVLSRSAAAIKVSGGFCCAGCRCKDTCSAACCRNQAICSAYSSRMFTAVLLFLTACQVTAQVASPNRTKEHKINAFTALRDIALRTLRKSTVPAQALTDITAVRRQHT